MGTSGSAYRRFEVTPNKAADVNAELDPVKTIKYKWPQSGVQAVICGEPTGIFDPLNTIPWRMWTEGRVAPVYDDAFSRDRFTDKITGTGGFTSFSSGNCFDILPNTFNGRPGMVMVRPEVEAFGRGFFDRASATAQNIVVYGNNSDRGHALFLLKMRDGATSYPVGFGPSGANYITYTFTPTGISALLSGIGGSFMMFNLATDFSLFFNNEVHLLDFEWGPTPTNDTSCELTIRIDGKKTFQIVAFKPNTFSNGPYYMWAGNHVVGEKMALMAAGVNSEINSGPFTLQAAYAYIKERFVIPLTYEI